MAELPYIITDEERETFHLLETTEERARFREAFWRMRDPNPAPVENEYREEHHRRFAYANQFLGRETNGEGWETDRGRYYIILGEARHIQRFAGDNLGSVFLATKRFENAESLFRKALGLDIVSPPPGTGSAWCRRARGVSPKLSTPGRMPSRTTRASTTRSTTWERCSRS